MWCSWHMLNHDFPVYPCSSHLCVDFRAVKYLEMLYLCKFMFEIILT